MLVTAFAGVKTNESVSNNRLSFDGCVMRHVPCDTSVRLCSVVYGLFLTKGRPSTAKQWMLTWTMWNLGISDDATNYTSNHLMFMFFLTNDTKSRSLELWTVTKATRHLNPHYVWQPVTSCVIENFLCSSFVSARSLWGNVMFLFICQPADPPSFVRGYKVNNNTAVKNGNN